MVFLFSWWVLRRLELWFRDLLICATLVGAWTAWWKYRVAVVTLDVEFFKFYIISIWIKFKEPMRFILNRALVHFLSPVYTSLDVLHIYLVFVRAALLGVGQRGSFSSHMFTTALWIICHMTIGLFCFTSFIPAPWKFGKTLRTPLCSWGLPFRF